MFKIIAVGFLVTLSSGSYALSLSDYLKQVEEQNGQLKKSDYQAEGARLVSREADLITSPQFFFQGMKSFDTALGTPPMNMFSRMDIDSYSAGISQQFNFGLQTKLSYSVVKTNYEGSTFKPPKYWDASPSIELKLPLWANGLGAGVTAQVTLAREQNRAEEYSSLAQSQGLRVEAEVTYWQLAAAQERVRIQEQALLAGKNILNYVNKQKEKNLGESADVLQANALVEAYRFQLQQAINERQKIERAFNKLLNVESNAIVPKLDTINYSNLESIKIPEKRPGDRLDVLAARSQVAIAKASSDLILERNKPTLDLIGSYSLQGRGVETGRAIEKSGKTNHDSGAIGIMFQMPLNLKAVADAKAGAMRLKNSAEINEKLLQYNQEQDWEDLKQKLIESKETLKLSRSMEAAQRAKLANERIRLRQGRTTTYQILLFEQDYSQAQASTVQVATQIIALDSQLKLYQGEK